MNWKADTSLQGHTDRILIGAYLLAALLTYCCLNGIYRPENTDDAWFLSVAHDHVVRGIETDVAYGTTPGTGGLGGVMLFGKTFSLLYGHTLNLLGWTKTNAHLISTACLVLSALCWYAILSKLNFGKRLAVFFALSLLVAEPFFGAANQARSDALSFFVVSTGFLLFLYRHYGLAGFFSVVALEIHPVGVVVFFFMASVTAARLISGEARELRWFRPLVWFTIGLGAGSLYYLSLHAAHLGSLPMVLSLGNTGASEVNNILFEYFFKTKYLRHIPELMAVVACAVFFVHKRYHREDPLVPVFFVASLVFTLVIRRPNFMYAIYVYPAFLLLLFWVFQRHNRLGLAAGLLLVYLLPQYGFVYLQNRHWDMEEYLAQVRRLTPTDNNPVLGRPNDWFAFVDRPFFRVDYLGDFQAVAPDALVLIEGEAFRSGSCPKVRSVTDRLYDSTECGRFQSRGETIVVKKLVAKGRRTGDHAR